ncbi:hypothetical protein [Amycolatopsis pigmentata]|uniref:Uncharacterized protein n=1 Tax=Amycolatopsis pigmentata TaxID=450801 RepID=A0ABW5FJ42_9PSEU
MVARTRRPTPADDPSKTQDTIADAVRELLSDYTVTRVGLGAAGFVDERRSTLRRPVPPPADAGDAAPRERAAQGLRQGTPGPRAIVVGVDFHPADERPQPARRHPSRTVVLSASAQSRSSVLPMSKRK